MAQLQLQLLGEFSVLQDAEVLALPPSKKTRALLAYLALNPRAFRREQLCELLWEIPDDPRGSLRWSLSKLRRLVDEGNQQRIVANRSHVSFEAGDARIDVLDLLDFASDDLQALPLDALEEAARQFTGEFLEGLELANFHEFYTWSIGQREAVSRAQALIHAELTQRLANEPDRALPYATQLAALRPSEEQAHIQLIQLFIAAGRQAEAKQHLNLARHQLQEAGGAPSQALSAALNKAAPAPAVTAISTVTPAPVTRSEGQLYGRESELSALLEALHRSRAESSAKMILLCGDPGIGKSKLLRAFSSAVQDSDTCLLEADAFELEIIRPFALWKDAFRRHPQLTPPAVLVEEGRVGRDQLFAGLSEALADQCRQRPVVVIFDDLQWCDESSAAALHYLIRMHRDLPLLILAGGRDAELRDNTPMQQAIRGLRHDALLDEIALSPLGDAEIGRIVTDVTPVADATRIAAECAGNPLLAIELARAESAGESKGSLSAMVRDRLGRMEEDAAELVMWASVLEPNIDLDLLSRMTKFDAAQVDRAVHAAGDQGMLVQGERGYRFCHDLICTSVYDEIPLSRQQAMHRRVAQHLEVASAVDLQLAADLAHHAAKSGEPALAARAMVSAGRLCLRFYANEDALNLALTGLEFAQHLTEAERVCLTLELVDVRVAASPVSDWEGAARDYADLAEQALDHGALPHARLGYQLASYLRWRHGDWADAQRDSLQAERVSRGASDEEHILGMAEAAKCLALLERDLPQADAMLMEARGLAERKRVSAPAIPMAQGLLRYYEGNFEQAESLLDEARTLCKSRGERISEYQCNEALLAIALERGHYPQARKHCNALLDIGEKLPEGSERHFARALDALLQQVSNSNSPSLQQRLQELRDIDAKHRLSFVLNRLALLSLERAEPETAVTYAREALDCTRLLGRASEMLLAHTLLAEALQRSGRTEALGQHMDAIETLLAGTVAHWARQRAEALQANWIGSTNTDGTP